MKSRSQLPSSIIDFGRYNLLLQLGRGGMGTVFLARQKTLRRFCAIKVMSSVFADDAEAAARFLQEARATASLSHPQLIDVFDCDQYDEQYFIAMEYIEGLNLAEVIREGGPMPVSLAIYWLLQAALGLEFVHQRQVIHRDIKPDNLMIDAQGALKITDLGLAKSRAESNSSMTMTGTMMGSPFYMSPEQINDSKAVDFRTDIYSLGITAYHMLTGNVPFHRSSAAAICVAHLQEPMPSVGFPDVSLTTALDGLIGRMVAKDREHRFVSTGELRAELESWASRFPVDENASAYLQKLNLQSRKVETLLEGAGISMSEVDLDYSAPVPVVAQMEPPAATNGGSGEPWMAWVVAAILMLIFVGGGLRWVQLRKSTRSKAVAAATAPANPAPSPSVATVTPPPPVVSATPTPAPVRLGMLRVRTDPSGAMVLFRSKSKYSPATFEDVPVGRYTVQISKQGYVDVEAEVLIQEEKPAQLEMELEKATTVIHVETVPPGAKLFADQDYVGETPCDVKGKVDQSVQVILELQGYGRHEQTLKFPDQNRSLSIRLREISKPKPSTISMGEDEPEKARTPAEGMLGLMDHVRSLSDQEWSNQKESVLADVELKLMEAGMNHQETRRMVLQKIGAKLEKIRELSQSDYDRTRERLAAEVGGMIFVARRNSPGGRPPFQQGP